MRKVFSVVMLVLVLLGMLTLAFNIKPAKADYVWTGTIYIRADGSVEPSDAPISRVGDTYTLTDNIVDAAPKFKSAIVIERDNIVFDGAGHKIQGRNAHDSIGINLSGRSNITIQNINIENFDRGILLWRSSNNNIYGNNITANNSDGIMLVSSSNNSISGNNITANNLYGIWLYSSSYNSIYGNNIANNKYYGIWLDYSSNNSIYGNNIANNEYYGIYLWYSSNNSLSGNVFIEDGVFVSDSYGNVVVDNLVNGRPLVYLEGVSDVVIEDAGQVILVNCNHIRVENLNLSHTTVGVELLKTTNTIISENNIANNRVGIWLERSSNYNSISGNNITNNWDGIKLYSSSNNNIYGNNITANNGYGIWLERSSNNNIYGNNITNNWYGICFNNSPDNRFWHNNIIENTRQVYDYALVSPDIPPSINVWDDGYPSGGNYWSDYVGVDYCSGPYQNETGSDGIGDTPYIIDENNVDRYPLMSPWSPTPPIKPFVNATVDIHPQSLNLKSIGMWISAYVELPEGFNVADINVSTILLNNTIPIAVNAPIIIGDYDNDTIPDLMVEFDRRAVCDFILSKGIKLGNVTLTLTGKLLDGTEFEGNDVIKVRMPGDINMDGKVDIIDIAIAGLAFGSYPGNPRWNPIADEKEDNIIDIFDIALIAKNFGEVYT